MVLVREVVQQDWQALRDIRLEGLRDAPEAFASTYEQQLAFTEADWRARITRGGTFLAYLPEAGPEEASAGEASPQEASATGTSAPAQSAADPVGIAGGYVASPAIVHVISMFVRPRARGLGVGEALIDAVADWAAARDATSLHLWVTESNKPARRLYERYGFTLTGERQSLESHPGLMEVAMARPL